MGLPMAARTVTASRAGSRGRAAGNSLYRWLAFALACVAVAGFARSYYLKGFFATRALPIAVHVHGVLMSAWLAVFIAQTWLIARRKVQWHRRLGIAAAVLALLIIALGGWLTVRGVIREAQSHRVGMFHELLLINFVDLLLFAVFLGAGLVLRSRPEVHKRLMLLAALTLVAPAAARIALLFTHAPLAQFFAFYGCVIACVAADSIRQRQLQPVLAFGALAIIAGFQLSYFVVQTHVWLALVARLFGG